MLQRVRPALRRARAVVRAVWRLLRPTWVAALIVPLVSVALLVPQGRDVLASLTDPLPGDEARTAVSLALLYVSALLFSTSAWHYPRALLSVDFGADLSDLSEAWQRRLRIGWPRLLGALPLLALAGGFARSGSWGNASGSLLAAAGFLALLWLRLRWFVRGGAVEGAPLVPELPPGTRRAAAGLLAVSTLLFLVFLVSPVAAPRTVGSGGILLLSGSGWIVAGTVLIYPGYRYGTPSLLVLLLLWAVAIGSCTDNHALRRAAPLVADERPALEEHFAAWRAARARAGPATVFVVSAEGGGIRAAYWTAAVLGELSDRVPGFACSVYAISGVSGGSVGGAVYAALLADAAGTGELRCGGYAATPPALRDRARRVLGQDFLAPVVAGMLTADLAQRLLPVPLLPDRSAYLELSLEEAWRGQRGSQRMAEDFRGLWRGPGAALVPSLFLNTTWVGTGSRAAIGNLRWTSPPAATHFSQLGDLLARLDHPLPLSTAAHASARFPYMSPPGSVVRDGRLLGRVVDGGYFENSGALTAAELLEALDPLCEPPACRLAPLVITNAAAEEDPLGEPLGALFELQAPIWTFFRTRDARGEHAQRRFRNAGDVPGLEFRLPRTGNADPPLGWMVSRRSQRHMDEAVRGGFEPTIACVATLVAGGDCPPAP